MSAPLQLVITGVGAVSPVGLSAAATCASLRAGIARLQELESGTVAGSLFDRQPVVGGRVPLERFAGDPLEWQWPGHERFVAAEPPHPERLVAAGSQRLIELAVPALRECAQAAGLAAASAQGPVAIYLGLDDADDPQPVAAAVMEALGPPAGRPAVVPVTAGRAAALVALRRAAEDLLRGQVAAAIVGGVDSLVRPEVLLRLEERGQLKGPQRQQGVIPGEAAAFVCLETAGAAAARGATPLAAVMGVGAVPEPTTGTDEPNRGEGLTTALRKARQYAGRLSAPPLAVCDLNGDRYRATEWAMASMRAFADLHGDEDLWHPADCIGDSGAASGALCLVWATAALRKAYATSDRVVVWGASDTAARAAAFLAAVNGGA